MRACQVLDQTGESFRWGCSNSGGRTEVHEKRHGGGPARPGNSPEQFDKSLRIWTTTTPLRIHGERHQPCGSQRFDVLLRECSLVDGICIRIEDIGGP